MNSRSDTVRSAVLELPHYNRVTTAERENAHRREDFTARPPAALPTGVLPRKTPLNATLGGIAAVGIGAALGAWLRWALGTWLNPVLPAVPLGTLSANLVGGYLVGVAVAYFGDRAGLPPEARLFAITGFLGGLTTFSTFSAEAVALLSRAQYAWAFVHVAVHLAGSIAMTILGIASVRWLRG
jgi:CrcB protein